MKLDKAYIQGLGPQYVNKKVGDFDVTLRYMTGAERFRYFAEMSKFTQGGKIDVTKVDLQSMYTLQETILAELLVDEDTKEPLFADGKDVDKCLSFKMVEDLWALVAELNVLTSKSQEGVSADFTPTQS